MQNIYIKIHVLIILFGILSLSGCGQKGPLYLPDCPPPITVVDEDGEEEEEVQEEKGY